MSAPTQEIANPAQSASYWSADAIGHIWLMMEHVRQANAAEGEEVGLHRKAAVQHAKQARVLAVRLASLMDGFITTNEEQPRIQRV